ncbi:MAG: M13 family metallopeptidase [Bacteroidota bacterium]
MKRLLFPAVVTGLALLTSCDNKSGKVPEVNDPIVAHIDSSIAPGENFFLFANNNWFKKYPIPSSEKSNGIFRTIQDTINESVRKICESSAAEQSAKGSNKQIGDYYFSGMDTLNIERTGVKPLSELLGMIGGISDQRTLVHTMAVLQSKGIGNSFGFYITQDDKNSSRYAPYLVQSDLGLPDRDYYFNTDARTANIRKEYALHLKAMFAYLGKDAQTAASAAASILKLENAFAAASRKMEDLRDPYKNYNKKSVAELGTITPLIDWKDVFTTYGINNIDSVVVGQPEFFTALDNQIKSTPLADWKAYLEWQVLNTYANYLNKGIEDQNFYFFSTVIDGVKERKPRWKDVVENTDGALGELIGQVYVDEYLPKGTKEKLLEIGNSIRDVYAGHIKKLDWMSEATKEKALSKLAKITMKVGYPDKWKDLSSVDVSRSSYVENAMAIGKWRFEYMAAKYGKPVDKKEWDMYPQTYNAYYNPANNEICVPACNIIVPGFEGRMPDDAVLYGIIGGSTFGHEITHGFDDQGSQYDENGNLNEWWTKEDREKFTARTKLIVEQYDNYVVLDSLHVRGENTQGENIADLGGVVMGYEAFKKTKQGQSKELFNGYTADQRFFLAYAYAWMVNRTDASIAKQIMSDVHSPAEFRINGPLSDVDQFYTAFNIKKGDKMWRDEDKRVRIW